LIKMLAVKKIFGGIYLSNSLSNNATDFNEHGAYYGNKLYVSSEV